jgi:hypothetical protein
MHTVSLHREFQPSAGDGVLAVGLNFMLCTARFRDGAAFLPACDVCRAQMRVVLEISR